MRAHEGGYYLRLMVVDQPGTGAGEAGGLGSRDVALAGGEGEALAARSQGGIVPAALDPVGVARHARRRSGGHVADEQVHGGARVTRHQVGGQRLEGDPPSVTRNAGVHIVAVGVVAGSSVLGMIIPPSAMLIIYSFVAEPLLVKMNIYIESSLAFAGRGPSSVGSPLSF